MAATNIRNITNNARLEIMFEAAFDEIYTSSSESERYYIIANKYIFRKLFVSSRRVDAKSGVKTCFLIFFGNLFYFLSSVFFEFPVLAMF